MRYVGPELTFVTIITDVHRVIVADPFRLRECPRAFQWRSRVEIGILRLVASVRCDTDGLRDIPPSSRVSFNI